MSSQSSQNHKRQEKFKGDLVDRFLNVLWKKEVGFKLTTKKLNTLHTLNTHIQGKTPCFF